MAEEKYNLEPSQNFNLVGREEENIDLQLNPSDSSNTGSITGTITDSNGNPISGATIKLFDSTGKPYEHATSSATGLYNFSNIPVGSYFLTVSKPGYLTPNRIPLSVTQNSTVTANIVMLPDPNANSNVLYGIVFDTATNLPVGDATVELFLDRTPNPVSQGIVKTNDEGQYLFAYLQDGTYYVVANKIGYLPTQSADINLSNGQFASLNINLNVDPLNNTGTVSGIIKDQTTGQPLANAIVVLYSIEGGNETIIRITKTNAGGLYLFGNLPQGEYKVKATVQT